MTKIYRCVNTKGYEHNSLIYPFGFEWLIINYHHVISSLNW
jgi:hypothetical protein